MPTEPPCIRYTFVRRADEVVGGAEVDGGGAGVGAVVVVADPPGGGVVGGRVVGGVVGGVVVGGAVVGGAVVGCEDTPASDGEVAFVGADVTGAAPGPVEGSKAPPTDRPERLVVVGATPPPGRDAGSTDAPSGEGGVLPASTSSTWSLLNALTGRSPTCSPARRTAPHATPVAATVASESESSSHVTMIVAPRIRGLNEALGKS
jgi:hypothetical protein